MSVDKLVDSTQLDADITSVANAIRTKGGTSASLAFPAGFVQAIGDIPTGGGGYTADEIAMRTAPSGDITLPTATTIAKSAFRDYSTITSIYGPEVLSVGAYAFNGTTGLKKIKLPKATSLGSGNTYTIQNSQVEQFAVPKLSSILPSNFAQADDKLTTIDIGNCTTIQTRACANCTLLGTVIIRKTASLVALGNIDGIANGTKFKSGGAGGTIYIPESLYDHLGDGGALDYKAATNWSTVNGYGTITWAKLEGSAYENEDWMQI